MKSRGCLVLLLMLGALVLTPDPARAQGIAPVPLDATRAPPPAYFERIQAQPDFFQIRDGWIRRTHSLVQAGAPLSGTLPVVLVLGLFSDSPEPLITHEDLQAALFDGPSEFGTVSGYFDEVSGGRLAMRAEALPWVRTTVTLAQAVADSYGLGTDAMTGAYLFEAVAAVDGSFDFGLFDNDGPDGVPNSGDDDGFVDAVAFQFLEVSASCGGPGLWPHRSQLGYWNEGEPFVTDDAGASGEFIKVNDYTIQSALDCGGVGLPKATTMAHELAHVLGLPDLYDRSQGLLPEERRWVVGCWSLMAAGAWGCGSSDREDWARPTHMGAWEKIRLGWLSGVEVVGTVLDQTFLLEPVQAREQVLKIPLEIGYPPTQGEYLLVEYRTREGFDRDLPASGVLIYHVDPKIRTNNPCELCPQEYMVELLEADGNNTLRSSFLDGGSRGEAGDAWGVAGPGRLTARSYPSTRLTSGSPSPVTIYDISIQDGLAHISLSSFELPTSRLVRTFLGTAGAGLSPEEIEYLDSHGNRTGAYDVGDLRAYLRR